MNNEGLNESSGIGTGLAQVFQPYTPQYDQGEIGMVEYKQREAKQKAAAEKQDKINKLTENIKTPLMLPKYQAGFKALLDDIVKYKKLGDEDGLRKAIADADAYGTAAKGIYELAKSTNSTILNQGHDKFEGLDKLSILHDNKRKVNSGNVFDEINNDYNAIVGITKKPEPFDYIKNINAAQNAVNPVQEGRRTFITPEAANDAAQHFVQNDPEFNRFYQDQFKQLSPDLQKKFGDYVAFGTADLAPQLVMNKTAPEPKGMVNNNYNYNNTGGEDKTPYPSSVYTSKTKYGTDKHGFTEESVSTSFNPSEIIISIPEGTHNTSDLHPIPAGGTLNMKGGEFTIGNLTTKPITNPFTGEKIPAGTPVPQGATEADVIEMFSDETISDDVRKHMSNKPVPTDSRILIAGLTNDGTSIRIPYERGSGAVFGSLGKDQRAIFKSQFDDIYKAYKKKGGTYDYTPYLAKDEDTEAPQNAGGKKGNVIDVDIDWSKYGK